jgi:Uma2 family endonuclease
MNVVTKPFVSAEEYLRRERSPENRLKHEWIDGEIRTMTGASRAHNLLVSRLVSLFFANLDQESYDVYPSDMRTRVPGGPYFYPDVGVAPNPPTLEDEHFDTVLDPLVVVEVLSPSTESYDRGEKLAAYTRIPSLGDYLLVDQERMRIDHYRRTEQATWELTIADETAATIALSAVPCELPLVEVYRGIPITTSRP